MDDRCVHAGYETTITRRTVHSGVQIDVRCYGRIRAIVDESSIAVTVDGGAAAEDVLEKLDATYPDLDLLNATLGADLIATKNATHLQHLDGFETELADGDVLSLSGPPMPE